MIRIVGPPGSPRSEVPTIQPPGQATGRPAPRRIPSSNAMVARQPPNIGQHVRNAFVHAISWWTRVADKRPDGLNLAMALHSSQLLRNMVTWFGANPVATKEAMAFYDADRRVQLDRLPGMMALMYVAGQVTGMPNWTHAALEAGDIDTNLELMGRQALDPRRILPVP